MTNEEVKTLIATQIPETVFEETQFLNATIPSDKLYPLTKKIRETGYDYLVCVTGMDWKDHLMVVYHFENRNAKHVFVLKAKITDRDNPTIDTVSDIWRTAELHEREVYDLFGIKFNNHPDLRRLFLDDTWGFPLRKNYKDDVTIVQL